MFEAEEHHGSPEKADKSLSHIIGSKDEDIRLLPDLSKTSHEKCPSCGSPQGWEENSQGRGSCTECGAGFEKDSRRDFSEMEKFSLIEEDGEASNAHKVDVKGTHYENQSASEIAMMILPLKGL